MKRFFAFLFAIGFLALSGPDLLQRGSDDRSGAFASAPKDAGTSPAPAGEARGECTVNRVIDGDTVDCAEAPVNSRLLLIDTPELAQGEYGRLAREALLELVPIGTVLRVEYDLDPRDQYGRDLVYLYLEDGRMVNEEMVRLGYAVVVTYPPNVRHVDRIRAAQEDARRAKRGLWSGSAFDCTPSDFRRGRC